MHIKYDFWLLFSCFPMIYQHKYKLSHRLYIFQITYIYFFVSCHLFGHANTLACHYFCHANTLAFTRCVRLNTHIHACIYTLHTHTKLLSSLILFISKLCCLSDVTTSRYFSLYFCYSHLHSYICTHSLCVYLHT